MNGIVKRKDGALLAMLLELGGTVAGLARNAMEGSLDPDGFALQELGEMEETFALIARTRVLLDEVEIPPKWRGLIVDLLEVVEPGY